MWSSLKNYSDGALLVARVLLGTLLIWTQGWPLLAGGLARWKGFAVRELGLTFWPSLWGFLAAFGLTIGCGLLVAGVAFRPAALLLFFVALLAGLHDYLGTSLGAASNDLVLALFCLVLLFVGPGRFSFDKG